MSDLPQFRITPMIGEPLTVPDWRAVEHSIPADFSDDGASDPFFLYLLGFIPGEWARRLRAKINEAGRRHDYGYGPGRLSGSMYQHVTKAGWDLMLRRNLEDVGHPTIAAWYWHAVDRFGARAWWGNWRKMCEWGWLTYADFVADVDKTYKVTADGMADQ